MIHPLSGLIETIDVAVGMASDHRHAYITLEHLTIAALGNKDVKKCLKELKVSSESISSTLYEFLDHGYIEESHFKPEPSDDFIEIVYRAVGNGMYYAHCPTEAIHVLLLILKHRPEGSCAVTSLLEAGLNASLVEQYLHRELETVGDTVSTPAPDKRDVSDAISKFCVNLNERAKESKIDPLIGRSKEIEDVCQTICRRSKNNAVLIGEPGTGKTSIVEGLALRITRDEVPAALKGAVVFALDLGSIVAGTRYRGEFEERMLALISELEKLGNTILFIDEIHQLLGTGATAGSAMDASNLLKPALARGSLRCVGSTTLDEFRKHFEKDRALLRRFRRIDVQEPTIADTKLILRGLRPTYEAFHSQTISDDALDAAVDLSVRYISKGYLPDKAIDVMDSALARQTMNGVTDSLLGLSDIEAEVARLARMPRRDVIEDKATRLLRASKQMKSEVFDQDTAIDTLIDDVMISDAGLRDEGKPIGSYLFTGPTGTGKSEVAKQLAKSLGIELVSFDMSEFGERHTVAGLIGAPPGYVGFGDGAAGDGKLLNKIDQHPHCVLLLDEIEKAHPSLYNILLQVMEEGRLSSAGGKEVDFRNVILIMTSNVGATASTSIGFNAKGNTVQAERAMKERFPPEFRNRLDAVIQFGALQVPTMKRIVAKFLGRLEVQAATRNVTIQADDAALEWLIHRGIDATMGARPMGRVVAEHVKKPLARMMLMGDLKQGGSARLSVLDDRLVVS